MTQYNTKNAILDLGFVDGCIRENRPDDVRLVEALEFVLDSLEANAVCSSVDEPRLLQ